jgi:S-adenosylmethionine hydrolase
VFVGVVDPGVGSPRKAVVALSKRGQYFVVPDNGLLTLVAEQEGLAEVREITNPAWALNLASPTFGGRDVFSPVAAHLSKGEDLRQVGPKLESVVLLPWKRAVASVQGLEGQVIGIELPYGNLVTNVAEGEFQKLGFKAGDRIEAQFGKKKLKVPLIELSWSEEAKRKGLVENGFYLIRPDGYVALASYQQNFSSLVSYLNRLELTF